MVLSGRGSPDGVACRTLEARGGEEKREGGKWRKTFMHEISARTCFLSLLSQSLCSVCGMMMRGIGV